MAGFGLAEAAGIVFGEFTNVVLDKLLRWSCKDGRSKNVWILSKPAKEATALGTIVMIILAGCVIMLRIAIVVNAVSVSRLRP